MKPLRSQTTYTVMVNAGIVGFDSINEGTVQNDAIHWDFTTTAVPVVGFTGIGSVTQYYDEDEPIVLSGDFFDERNVEVYFNDVEAYRVRTRTDEGETLLEVYLPRGRNRLTPGIYTILVRNDRDHEFEVFGAFSVVKEAAMFQMKNTR